MSTFLLPFPYLPSGAEPDSFEDRAQQNLDALAIAIGELRDRTSWRQTPRARVYKSGTQTIANAAALAAVTYDSERWDTNAIHSTAANTSRLTCVTPGLYDIGGYVEWATNSVGKRTVELLVTFAAGGTGRVAIDGRPANTESEHAIYSEYVLAAGDYVELRVFQNSGGNLNVTASEFYMHWVSP